MPLFAPETQIGQVTDDWRMLQMGLNEGSFPMAKWLVDDINISAARVCRGKWRGEKASTMSRRRRAAPLKNSESGPI
jgi:hypothetical protein